jgi:small-conductance mechanosensitive channel
MILGRTLYGDVQIINVLIGLLILVFGIIISKAVSLYVRRGLKDKIKREYADLTVKTIYYSLVIFVLLSSLPMLGLKLSALLVAGGVAGIAIGFAGQNILGNLISGVFLLIERPIKPGNPVSIDGTVGIVEDIQIISTTLRTFEGLYVRMPNQKVFTSNIINYEANVARRFQYIVGIRYSDDAEKAIDVICSVINKESLALKEPAPRAFVSELGDNSVNITVQSWAPVSEWHTLYRELLWKIKTALESEGIEIPFPQRVLWQGEKQK